MVNLYRIDNLKMPLTYNRANLDEEITRRIGQAVSGSQVARESVDARKKKNIHYVIRAEFQLDSPLVEPLPTGVTALKQSSFEVQGPPRQASNPSQRVVVIGAGPAGMFATLALVEAGLKPILLERGKPVDTRMRDIGQLRSKGTLDPESNVCFGEGGAGAYTDGKLYTRIKDPYVAWVMRRLVDFEAPQRILYKAHPHLGTDKLVRIVRRMREYLIEQGAEVRFQTRVERLLIEGGAVRGVVTAEGEQIDTSRVILAVGHSARDTLATLHRDGVALEAKPFAVGVRVEHPQALINRGQYGVERHESLGAAAYQLTHQVPDAALGKRGVYTFCMCPGGFIVPSPTEPEHMAVNGMSNANRSTPFANSGVVVQVTPQDLLRRGFADSPLIGFAFQRTLEAAAFKATNQAYASPGMRLDNFVNRRAGAELAPTNYRPGIEVSDLWSVLPEWIAGPLAEGLTAFDRKIRGYVSPQANILAVESRTSSPIRVPRGQDMVSISTRGLYPVGEGAGYAGGIVSAAVDGVRAAENIIG